VRGLPYFLVLGWTLVGASNSNAQPAFPFQIELGPKEVVFDWSRDRCADLDVPDEPLRAFRRDDGAVIGIASHSTTRRFFISPDGKFSCDCVPIMQSRLDPDPAHFNYKTWIASTWANDGEHIVGLADNEFRGNELAGECPFETYYRCWYNAVVVVESRDGGAHFDVKPGSPIAVADFDNREMPGVPRGYFGPSNIIEHDDARYAVIYTTGGREQPSGTCLFRSREPGDIGSWEYWAGKAFVRSAYDPYRDAHSRPPCMPIRSLPGRVSSISRYGEGFVAVFAVQGADQRIGKIGIAFSENLLEWSGSRVLLTPQMIWSTVCGQPRYAYPSIIDLGAKGRNFDDITSAPYLYLTEAVVEGCAMTTKRNLVRYRLIFDQRAGSEPIN
jgi:hypothetical protein